ncbi:hypothetical protein D3C85_732410 [compost metagenome]
MKLRKPRLIRDWKKQLKSYSFLSMLGNFLVALSVSGLSVLGVLSSNVALPLLVSLAVAFGLFGLVGRFIDQSVEDSEDNAE